MELTSKEKGYIKNLFYNDGYVLSNWAFSDATFSQFTINSVGEDIKDKYNLSKGKSLVNYFNDNTIDTKSKLILLQDLIDFAENEYVEIVERRKKIFGDNSTDPVLNPQDLQRCKDILQRRNGATVTTNADIIHEKGLKELVKEAQDYWIKDKKVAVEKIWDALERLKSNYAKTDKEKKASIEKIVNDISHGHPNYQILFDEEFKKLTEIGNNYRIRHHETTKIDIIDDNYYDYFYNRCLALVDLATRYLK